MTRHLDTLATPRTEGVSQHACECLARELLFIAIAFREQANLLHAAGDGRTALAIVQINALADLVQERSRRYTDKTAIR